MAEAARRRIRPWMLLVPAVLVVGLLVAASLLQPSAPPGAQIVNQPLPDKHPAGPCFECHPGMPAAGKLRDRPLPQPHPADRCAECHEGYAPAPPAASNPPQ